MRTEFLEKIENKKAVVGIVGLGYVGLPLLIEFSVNGFPVIGIDIDEEKVQMLNEGKSYIRHIPSEDVAAVSSVDSSHFTTDFAEVEKCDAVILCVPTPLTEHNEPDMSYIVSTAEAIAPYVQKGQIITLESTTYPGTSEEVLIPVIEKGSGLKAGDDFFVAYSPEREDPNNPKFKTATIPKVVGGLDEASLEIACALYDRVVCQTVPVSSCRAAEATKLMENIFRCVNIALVNELKDVFARMDIDIWEVVDAAKTKPFGYMPFYPGPGLGGHCIPIDPFYLTWKAREYGVNTRFIELAGEINTKMPEYVVHKTMEALNEHGKALKGSRILIAGLAYKKNVDDVRESPTFVLWHMLEKMGAVVDYLDDYCSSVPMTREHKHYAGIQSKTIDDVENYDLVLISTDHDCVDYDLLVEKAAIVVDTRNACPKADNVYKA